MIKIAELLRSVKDLPPMPHTVSEIMSMSKDEDSSTAELAKVVESDQSLSMNVLRICNSAFYGLSRPVKSVNQATVFLGFQAIQGLVLANFVHSAYSRKIEGYQLEKGSLWKHSLIAATAAKLIAQTKSPHDKDMAFTAGLVHDVGKIVIGAFLDDTSIAEIFLCIKNDNLSFVDAEEKVLGYGHDKIGAEVARMWHLPAELYEAILYHHHPEQALEYPSIVAVTHLANSVASLIGDGSGIDGMFSELNPQALELLNMSLEEVEKLIADILVIIETQQAFFDV